MGRLRLIIIAFLALLTVGVFTGWVLLKTEFFWTWSGHRLIAFTQDRLYPKLTVGEVRGHPLTGITFTDILIASPQGVVAKAKRLELRLSLWSLVKLQPVIAKLHLYEPEVNLWRDPDGNLNVSKIFRKLPPPPFRSIDFPEIMIQAGEVTYTEAGETKRLEQVDLQCALIVLHPKRPNQAILVRRAMLAATTPKGRYALRTRCAYRGNFLNVLALEIYEGRHLLALLAGRAQLGRDPSGLVSGEFKRIPGETVQRFIPKWPETWDLKGNFYLEASPARITFTSAGKLKETPFILEGRWGQETGSRAYELKVNLAELKPDLLAPWNPSLAETLKDLIPFSTKLHLKGSGFSWPPASLEANLALSPFRFKNAQVDHLEIKLTGTDRQQTLTSAIRGNFGRLSLNARGPLLSEIKGNLTLEAEDLKPLILGLEGPPGTSISGTFGGNFSLPAGFAPDRVRVSGDLAASGRLGPHSLENFRSRLVWEKPNLQITQARVKVGDLAAEFNGSLKGETFNFQAQGRLPQAGVSPWPIPVRGQITMNAGLKGTWRLPQFTFQAEGKNLSWKKYAVRSARLEATSQGWPPSRGQLDLRMSQVKTPSGKIPQAFFTCQGSDNAWRFHLKARSPQGPRAELLGVADLSERPFSLSLERAGFRFGTISGKNITPVRASFWPGLTVEPATIQVSQGRVTLEGRMLGQEVSARLKAQDVPAEIFQLGGYAVKGKIKGRLTITGRPGNPTIQGELQAGPGRVSEFAFSRLKTNFDYQNSFIVFSGSLEEKDSGPRLIWDGKIPLVFSLSPWQWAWGPGDLQVTLKGENTNLAMLTAFSEEIQEAEGQLSILTEWRGTMTRPQLTGHIRWGSGHVLLRQSGLPYRLLPGEARLEGSSLVIPHITMKNRGTAKLTGKVTFEGFSPRRIEARASIQDFKALSRSGSEAIASGKVTLSGPWTAPSLKGRIILDRASFRTAYFQTGIHHDVILVGKPAAEKDQALSEVDRTHMEFYRNLAMDMQLSAPEGAWVTNKRLKVKLAGNLDVTKSPGNEVLVKGLLQANEGIIDVQGREFKIIKGVVHLPGRPGADVTTKLRAINKSSTITLILDAHGPVNDPEVELSSDPALPPADVLSYLVFNRPAQALTQEQHSTIGQQAMGILGGITAKTIKSFLGKDFPLVGDVYVKGSEESVGVAKPLTKDLTVSFERKTEPLYWDDTDQVRVDYRVNRYLSIESQLGRRNSGADVLFNLDF